MDRKATISVVIPVYRDPIRAVKAAKSMLNQQLPPNCGLEVILVDDGSGDGTADFLAEKLGNSVLILALQGNVGRSIARNEGSGRARGEYVVFMDCDCQPVNDGFLLGHYQALQACVASSGSVEGSGSGFWHAYQCEASERRRFQHAAGLTWAGSSQNMAVRRSVFHKVGGFDPSYSAYGFEDRDLMLRIARIGAIAWTENSVVRHLDEVNFAQVAGKMREAGGQASRYFAGKHPLAYRQLGYAAVDVRLHPWLRPAAWIAGPFTHLCAAILDKCAGVLPYSFSRACAKVLAVTAFLHGTSMQRTDDDKRVAH